MDLNAGDTGAGTQNNSGEPGGNGTGGEAFLSGLNDANRSFAEENGFSAPDAVFDGYRSLQEKLGSAVVMPGDDATDEQRGEFYKTVSASWTPEGEYTFGMPEGLPEDFAYDQDFAKEAGGWFKEAGLHPTAAQALHDKWVGKMADMHGQSAQAAEEAAQKQAEAVETAHRELVKEYGDPASDGYKNLVAKADVAMKGLAAKGIDVSSWFAEKGVLTDPGEDGSQQVQDPTAVKLLAFLHDNAFGEDTLRSLAGDGAGTNPFDTSKPDLSAQSDLVRNNPDKARMLIRAAGRDPKIFNL